MYCNYKNLNKIKFFPCLQTVKRSLERMSMKLRRINETLGPLQVIALQENKHVNTLRK